MKTGPIKINIKELYNETAFVMSHATGSVEGACDADKFTDQQIVGCINLIRQYVSLLEETSEEDLLRKLDESVKREIRKQRRISDNEFKRQREEKDNIKAHNNQMRKDAKKRYI